MLLTTQHICVSTGTALKGNLVRLGPFQLAHWSSGPPLSVGDTGGLNHAATTSSACFAQVFPVACTKGMYRRKARMTDDSGNSSQNATIRRTQGLCRAWVAVMACVASAFILLPWRSNADDCWTDSGCLVAVNFPGWIGTPETCWQGPTIFPAEGAVGNYVTTGDLVAVQAPPWILRVGDMRRGSIHILPNDGTERTNTVVFLVALNNMASQCSVVVRQAAAKVPAPRLISPTLIPSAAFQFGVVGVTNRTCVIEASTDLLNWRPVGTNSSPSGSFMFSEAGATNLAARFYRVAVLP
jgi:hypothetical protein